MIYPLTRIGRRGAIRTQQQIKMSLAEAWLVLIAGVSLLQARVELNKETCNRVGGNGLIDYKAFGMRCMAPEDCSLSATVSQSWNVAKKEQLDICPVLIGIRPFKKEWMIVMQLRGSDVDHQFGLKLSIETPGSSGVKEMVKCFLNNNKPQIEEIDISPFKIELKRHQFVENKGGVTICEVILENKDHDEVLKDLKKLAISFKKAAANSVARTDEATDIQIKPWILNTNQEATRCAFPKIDPGHVDGPTQFFLPVSSWEQELTCNRPGETIENLDKYTLHYKVDDVLKKLNGAKCDTNQKSYRGAVAPSTDIMGTDVGLTLMCVASACSMCGPPPCEGSRCAKLTTKGGPDTCAQLTCNNVAEAWYEVDGRPAAKGTPLCAKKKVPGETDPKRMYKKRVEGAGKDYYGWTFNGQPAEKFICADEHDIEHIAYCEKLIVKDKSKLNVTTRNVNCSDEHGKMRYKDKKGDTVELRRLDCDIDQRKWMQVAAKDNTTSDFPVNRLETLHCYGDKTAGAAGAGAATAGQELIYVGAGAGGIALVAIVAVVVYFLCCKRRKTQAAQKSKGAASMTAVSSGDHVKKSESSQIKSAPAAPSSVPVTFETIKEPKSAQVAPRSDNVSEQKKEEGTTKKEFLKFDDSNMSDIQNVSKKKDETDRLDVLQQEADKLSQEQKKDEEKKKKKENLYPRLNDIDDDWNDTKESVEKKKEEKKEGAASDKTTIQSKLTSRPLKNAPHDDGQYEALGMQTVLMEKTAIGGTTGDVRNDESGTSKKSARTRTKMAIADGSRKGDGDESRKDGTSNTGTKTGAAPPKTDLQTALDAKLADIEKTAIYNDDGVEEGGTQATSTRTKTVMATGKTKATTIAGTQSKDDRTTQGGVTGAGATTQRTRTQTRTRGDPTQIPSDGVTARDPTAQDETQMPTDGMTARGHTTADPAQMTDGRTACEVTANDGTQATDGLTAKELTPVDFTQGGTRTGRTAKELTAADFTQNRTTITGRTARSATRGDDTQMPTMDGRTALTRTRATRTQDQTTRTADQETQDPTVINDPTQILTRTRRTSRTQDGTTAYDPTQDPTMFNDQTQLTEGRTGMTKTRASRTQMSRTGTTQDPTAFDPTQDPTAFDQTQLTGGGRTRTSRTQGATTATQADPTGMTQDQTTINDLTQLPTEGRTGMTKTRASRTQSQTRTGATQDQTGFDLTQDPTAFDQTQLTGGGRTRTTRTQAATTATQADPTRTGFTQDQTMAGDPTQITDGGRTGVTRTRAKTTQEQTRDPTGTQEATLLDGATQLTDGRTGVTKTRASRTQDPSRTTQNQTTAFDQTQVNTDGRTAVSRTKVTRTKDRTQEPTTAFDGTQAPTDAQTAVSRTKGRTTQGETTAADGTQLQTEGRTAVSRTKGRTTQDGATAFDGTQAPTDGKTAVSRTKGRTTQDGATAFDGTQAPTDGQTAMSRTKGRTTQDGTTAVSRTKNIEYFRLRDTVEYRFFPQAGRTQEPTTAATRGQTTRTQEPTTAPTRGQTTRTQARQRPKIKRNRLSIIRSQEATAVTPQTTAGGRTAKERTRTKSQDGTRTPQDTQADGQTEAKTGSKERTTGASRTGAEVTQAKTQSRTGAELPQTPSEFECRQRPYYSPKIVHEN
ncbi:hypothetical protein PRIPAC_90953 [Pristionchus pacificus]|uniref:Uncharacterized protein n=1 Tax=Pristionchus pacificus TaxID=54126 RepID=A0A2A6B6C2_PRIPA|nr:hypothetical protein PRIPAC_90953 [Pristionchus pacificus]|eukprot:PDM61429.1 hypothetical protein PRIPAC_50871 [Pristionchus pacificus]